MTPLLAAAAEVQQFLHGSGERFCFIFAGRLQDWADIEKVLVRQRAVLDWNLVRDELKPLLALREAPERLDQLDQMRSRLK